MNELRLSFCKGEWCRAAMKTLVCAMFFATGQYAAAANRGQQEV